MSATTRLNDYVSSLTATHTGCNCLPPAAFSPRFTASLNLFSGKHRRITRFRSESRPNKELSNRSRIKPPRAWMSCEQVAKEYGRKGYLPSRPPAPASVDLNPRRRNGIKMLRKFSRRG